jgi:hypothetical protein
VGEVINQHWRAVLVGLFVAVVAYFVLFHAIGSLVPNYSASEIATQQSATSLQAIWRDPVNAPFKLLVWLPFKLGHHSVLWTRLAAATVGAAAALLFYFVLTHLYSRRVALLATVLFVFSTGFLHAARLGTPLIMQIFGIILLMAIVPLYNRSRSEMLPVYLSTIALAMLVYVPTLIWFIVVGGIVTFKPAKDVFLKLPARHKIILTLLFLGLLMPFIWSIVRTPLSVLTFLGLPQHLPTLGTMLTNLYSFIKSLVWHGTGPAEIMLVGAPIVNVIEAGLIIAGVVTLVRSVKLKSNLFIVGATLLFIVLVAFGDTTYLPLVPFLFLLLASGIFYLLSEWFDVFPLNPVANVIGTAAICLLAATSVLFHIRSYFIAWPHSTETRAAFSYPQPTNYFVAPSDSKNSIHF